MHARRLSEVATHTHTHTRRYAIQVGRNKARGAGNVNKHRVPAFPAFQQIRLHSRRWPPRSFVDRRNYVDPRRRLFVRGEQAAVAGSPRYSVGCCCCSDSRVFLSCHTVAAAAAAAAAAVARPRLRARRGGQELAVRLTDARLRG